MPKGKNNFLKTAVIFLMIILLAVGVFFVYSYAVKDINGAGESREITVRVNNGDTQYEVSQSLYKNGVVINDTLWSLWTDRHYPDFEYTAGEYILNSNMSYEQIAQKLKNPDVSHKSVSLCIPEGYSVFDIADAVDNNGICSRSDFLEACKSREGYDYAFLDSIPNNKSIAYELEGFLFPATYDLEENTPAREVVCQMLEAFDYRIKDSWTEYCTQNNMTLYELITLASVVEKETLGDGVAQNIASVFINRLDAGQRLQSDVTIFYGNELRENGFEDETVWSYNTYKCDALPSGPVCNPGEANIDAVTEHNDTDYFYFFSDLENQFHFAKTYDEFERLKQQYPWE